jgi:hypothetical protein
MADDNLQELYTRYLQFTELMLEDGRPLEVAATMMAQALSLYKTVLNAEDYDRMVDSISDSRDKVKSFEGPYIN